MKLEMIFAQGPQAIRELIGSVVLIRFRSELVRLFKEMRLVSTKEHADCSHREVATRTPA
jgi:hypothetical protein